MCMCVCVFIRIAFALALGAKHMEQKVTLATVHRKFNVLYKLKTNQISLMQSFACFQDKQQRVYHSDALLFHVEFYKRQNEKVCLNRPIPSEFISPFGKVHFSKAVHTLDNNFTLLRFAYCGLCAFICFITVSLVRIL